MATVVVMPTSNSWEGPLLKAHSVLTRARKLGYTPWQMIRTEGVPDTGTEGKTIYLTAASIAEAMDVLEENPEKDFSSCFYSKQGQNFIRSLSGSLGVEGACGQFTVSFHLAAYEAFGKHRYVVSEGLATLLALTELRGLKVEDLKLPHKSLRLDVPSCLGLKVQDESGEWQAVRTVFVHEDTKDDSSTPGSVIAGRSWRILGFSDMHRSEYGSDSAQAFFSIPLIIGDTAEEAVTRMRSRQEQNNKLPDLSPKSEAVVQSWVDVWRWVMNVMVYATTPDSEADHVRGNADAESIWRRIQKVPKGSPKREKLNEQLRGMDQQWQTVLGRSVSLTPALREMYEHSQSQGNGNPLRVRTLVSGHWQRFAAGPGRLERVWKYRQPFWRGPEDGPVVVGTEHRFTE